jgi:SsrA-binding protein
VSKTTGVNIVNKKASFEFHILQKYTAGIQLTGTEVKSTRLGNVNLNEAFCFFKNDELYVRGMNIGTFKQGSYNNHETLRVRKLLLKKAELSKLQFKSKEKGFQRYFQVFKFNK